MNKCRYCGKESKTISGSLGFCYICIKEHFQEVWPHIKALHDKTRLVYGLPLDPPLDCKGLKCGQCLHQCQIGEGERGYCGIRKVENGVIRGGRPHEGNLSYYYDPLPTNCVADFVCPGGTGTGYPKFAVTDGPEYGFKNLAVFYHACSFNCLYCQNYHFKEYSHNEGRITAKGLAQAVDKRTSCICYFGGDPTPQILHAIKASKLALGQNKERILRICWETNGAMDERYLKEMADLSLSSGGCIKFDLKAWDERIHLALCGVTNKKTLENFKILADYTRQRPQPPFLIASTLLVPGYVDVEEVSSIAKFIAELNPKIPYSLLGFHPHFYLNDLPTTSRTHAYTCKQVAEDQGLRNVHIGNIHLLGQDY